MSFCATEYPLDKGERYALLLTQVQAITDGIHHPIANLANVAALLYQGLPSINWCGFYLMNHGALLLGPFCGLPACIQIPIGRGVCGAAVRNDAVQCIQDVHTFPGHIACDSASNSEIVIPLHVNGQVIGVLDIDSPMLRHFDKIDQIHLSAIMSHLETCCDWSSTGYTLV